MLIKILVPIYKAILFLSLGFGAHCYGVSNKIGIVVFDGVLTSDVTAPAEVFGIASNTSWFSNYEVIFINVGTEQFVTTEEGLGIRVDAFLKDTPKVDVLLIPSAYDMKPLLNNESLLAYIRSVRADGKWLASNCSGAFVLAESGVLDNKKATTWSGGESGFQDDYPGVKVQHDTNYVVDDKIISSNGSVVSYQAALVLLQYLAGESKAEEVRETLQMKRVWDI